MQIIVEKRRKQTANPASGPAKSSGPFPLTVDLPTQAGLTVGELKAAIAKRVPRLSPERQRLTLSTAGSTPLLDDRAELASVGVVDGVTVQVKDLGPQVGWRTTFICEYLGPFLANPLFYFFPQFFYRSVVGPAVLHSPMQKVALLLFELHFAKRLYETIFVHRFSNGTMPLTNLIKNTAYYTLMAGVSVGFWVYGPWNTVAQASSYRSPLEAAVCVALFLFAEVSNYITHRNLSSLRPPGTRVRKIPRGYGFDLVSCPNYLFEVMAWVVFTYYTRSLASLAFTLAGAGQMYVWAVKKHRNYLREFPDYPKDRRAMI
ncbi:3-oxo-5-alpha-steroid 4-dehydrogenase-domain-containing protein, partial [Dimargaris cristalligena]